MDMSWIELVGALISMWAVWLTAQRKPWSWPVGLLSVALYVGIFAEARLYSDALLQVAFAVLIVYGWHRWLKNLDDDGRVQIARLPTREAALHIAIGIVGALLLGFAMQRWTDAALPWLDATLTAFSLVAQWWQARRHIAAWWLWVVVDVIYVGEYVYKHLLITSVLYAGFVVMAAIGARSWQRTRQLAAADA